MVKSIQLLNLVLFMLLIALDVAYIVADGIVLKSIASAVFVLVGIVNLVYAVRKKAPLKFPIAMMIGLVFAMLGDIILEIEFIIGAVLFAVGHIFFFVSYCFLVRFNYKDLIYGAIIFVPSLLFIVLAPIFEFDGALMEIVCVVYALIICLMVGKAISNVVKNKNVTTIIILIGSIMFFLSDLMLLLNVFAGLPVVGIICLVLYYPAEFLLAYSIYSHANTINNKVNPQKL